VGPRAGLGVLQKSFIRAGIQTPDRMARNLLSTSTMLPRLLSLSLSLSLSLYIYIYIYTYTHTYIYTGLYEMIVGVLTTCHTQYT